MAEVMKVKIRHPGGARADAQRPDGPSFPSCGKTRSIFGRLCFDRACESVGRSPRWRDVAALSALGDRKMHNPLSEMNMLPPKSKKLTPTHSCFDSENHKLL